MKRRGWMAATLSSLALFATGAVAQTAKPVLVDAIVVVVNSDVITHSELQKRVQKITQRLRAAGKKLPEEKVLKKQVAEQLIIERIQVQKAKEQGMHISDAKLDRAISRIAAQNSLTVQQLRAKIEGDGTAFSEFRQQVRQDIMTRRIREREVNNKVQVMDSEVDNYLAAEGGDGAAKEVNLAHILIRIPENASPEQIAASRKRASDVMSQLKSGKPFDQVALSNSDGAAALKGGDLGWRKMDELPELFAKATADLKDGEVSKVVRSPNGFHILKVAERRQSQGGMKLPPVQQIHARHILIKVTEIVPAEEAQRKLQDIKQRLENKAATFDEMARLYSNDASAGNGGDLGWLYPGDTVPEFERAMVALKPGEVSEPVQTPFGYHLIEVLERKTDEASQERVRMAVRKAMRERKIAEATENWLRQLRDSAYVQYRMDL